MPGLSFIVRLRRALWLLMIATVGGAGATAALDLQDHPVRAELMADVATVTPGQSMRLGVRLRMDPGWHTYWEGIGDAGMPTQVEWRLPPGWQAGPLQWPAPEKYVEEGDLVAYGYKDEVLLFADIVVPPQTEVEVEIGAAVSWLVCREVCIPGSAVTSLVLPLDGKSSGGGDSLFAVYAARVPPSLEQAEDLAIDLHHQPLATGIDLRLDLRLLGAGLELVEGAPDFYPTDAGGFRAFGVEPINAAALHLTIEPYEGEEIQRLKGLVVFGVAGQGRQYRYVDLDLSPSPAPVQQGRGLGRILLLALVGGLILNLMPCVLPVISLKIMGLVSHAGESPGRVRVLGLAFCGGVIGTFVALAAAVVALKAGGQQVGWGFQFQEPAFVLFMAALVFVLALSLLGVFEIRLPGFSGSADKGEGVWNSVFNGVLATVLATPCTAPFLGTALGFAFTQPPLTILAVFVASGSGMALPYGILALRPAWMRFLPRPGAWMLLFKQAMGFVLMATVLWLLWVLGQQRGADAVIWAGALLLALALASWLVGTWLDLGSSPLRRVIVWTGAVLSVSVGVWGVIPALQGPPTGMVAKDDGVWLAFSPARLDSLRREEKLIFLDFTAAWCWTCKINERTVLDHPEVRRRFVESGAVLVKADWTDANPDITRLLGQFGRSGVPLYVIYPPDKNRQPLVLPEIITRGIVLEKLAAAEGS
jgi:DsbC/DsbD-like thiol-disulfide interchange protein